MKHSTNVFDTFFKDKHGQIVLWQWPKIPLSGWILCRLVTLVITQHTLKSGFSNLGTAFLFTWAYLEITDGVTYFRRSIGAIVMGWIIIGFFR